MFLKYIFIFPMKSKQLNGKNRFIGINLSEYCYLRGNQLLIKSNLLQGKILLKMLLIYRY